MTWRDLLQTNDETIVAPWIGGRSLRVGARSWSIEGDLPPEQGWYEFRPAGRKARVPGLVSPGSSGVKRQAEEEGLDRIFREAGLEWAESGCSMCVGINGDVVPPGERCASSTNRNFKGRQGPGARTHLMSPAMVAAAALAGHLADVRPLIAGRA